VGTAAPGVDAGALAAELGGRHEVLARALPVEVRNVADLGSLPAVLGGFLAALAVLAVLHALVVTVRQRSGDLAVLGALGATRRQVRAALVTTAVAIALVGVVVGLPLGWGVGRLVWAGLARSIGVAPDVVTPPAVLAVPVVAVAVAVLLALGPARRVPDVATAAREQRAET
jgi:putative ABC transport system permease protein